MKSALFFSAVLAVCATLPARAADWRQFRGPNGAGVSSETNLPTALDPARSIAWQAALPGRGLSSPIIVGERVFVTASSGAHQERLHVLCFNAADGARIWERQFWATGRTTCHEKIAVAAPTPVSDGARIFALFSSNDLLCLDLEGNLLWLRGLTRDYPDASNSLGMSSSPVVADGVLVVQVENDGDSFAAGLDVATGVNRWRTQRPKKANWTSPLLLANTAGKPQVVLQSSAGLSTIEPATGKEVWSFKDGASTVPSSAVSGNVLFVPSRGMAALRPDAEGGSPKVVWQSTQLRPATGSPLAVGGQLFTLNDAGVLTSAATATGERQWQLRLKGPFSSSPVAADGHLYVVNEAGLVQVVDPAKPEGEVVGELALGQVILATPSIAGGGVYFRSDAAVWKLKKP